MSSGRINPGKLERRASDQRREEIDRRGADGNQPERREGHDRRGPDLGPPDRREVLDRRYLEAGPPCGWKDRRRSAERRVPEVIEASFAEWVRLRATLSFHAEPAKEATAVHLDFDEAVRCEKHRR